MRVSYVYPRNVHRLDNPYREDRIPIAPQACTSFALQLQPKIHSSVEFQQQLQGSPQRRWKTKGVSPNLHNSSHKGYSRIYCHPGPVLYGTLWIGCLSRWCVSACLLWALLSPQLCLETLDPKVPENPAFNNGSIGIKADATTQLSFLFWDLSLTLCSPGCSWMYTELPGLVIECMWLYLVTGNLDAWVTHSSGIFFSEIILYYI